MQFSHLNFDQHHTYVSVCFFSIIVTLNIWVYRKLNSWSRFQTICLCLWLLCYLLAPYGLSTPSRKPRVLSNASLKRKDPMVIDTIHSSIILTEYSFYFIFVNRNVPHFGRRYRWSGSLGSASCSIFLQRETTSRPYCRGLPPWWRLLLGSGIWKVCHTQDKLIKWRHVEVIL